MEENKEELQLALDDAIEGAGDPPKIVETVEELEKEESKPKKERKYLSKEEWEASGRDPAKWKDPEKFKEHGSFFEKIESQTNYIKSLESKLKKIEQEQKQRKKEELEYHRRNLEYKKDLARLNSQVDDYAQADEQLRNLQNFEMEHHEVDEDYQAFQQEAARIDEEFKEKNRDWYNLDSVENIRMAERAENIAKELFQYVQGGQMGMHKLVSMVEEQIRKEYPHRFDDDEGDLSSSIREEIATTRQEMENLKQAKVESSTYRKSKFTVRDIPSEHRSIYQEAVQRGMTKLTPKEYYDKLRGVK